MPNKGVRSPSASAKCSVHRVGGRVQRGGGHSAIACLAPHERTRTSRCGRAAPAVSSPGSPPCPKRLQEQRTEGTTGFTSHPPNPQRPRDREQETDIPLSSSVASAVSESPWLSARPVQISCCRTASAMGITMAVVDVLLSHMERNTVQHMKPSTSLSGREGQGFLQGTDFTHLVWTR